MPEPDDANVERREQLVARMCAVMGWEYKKAPVWTALRKVAVAEAVAISLDKLEEVLTKLEALPHARS